MLERVLITGSEGTIGTPLKEELRYRGYDVFGVDLFHTNDPQVMRADITNWRQLKRAFEWADPTYVYHLAAEFGRNNGEEYYEDVWTTNAIGTRHVLELSHIWDAPMFFAGSSEAYGDGFDGDLHENLLERTPPILLNEYAISKYTNELQILNFKRRNNSKSQILRFFNAYGPGEKYTPYRSVVSLFVYRALHNIPIEVYEDYHRTFMYVGDFIPTLANCCLYYDDKFPYVINIGGNDYRSVEELAEIVLQETNANRSLLRLLPKESHNVLNKKPDIGLAKKWLRHDPQITLEEGVPLTVNWMEDFYEPV